VFVTVSHCHPCLIFAAKDCSLPFEGERLPSPTLKCKTKVELADSTKHISLQTEDNIVTIHALIFNTFQLSNYATFLQLFSFHVLIVFS
jgi:hypothetical protein